MKRYILLFSAFFYTSILTDDVVVDLKNPVYKGSTLTTSEGGVVKTDRLYIQAKNFTYSHSEGNHIVKADGEMLIVYHHKYFVGDSFEYNFETKEGVIKNGVCNMDNFFTGGKTVYVHPDGSIDVEKAFFTTSETAPPYWQARAREVHVDERTTLKANHLTLEIYKFPVFWYPSYSTTIKKEFQREPAITYRLLLEHRQDPLILLRTKIWDGYGLKAYVRGELRLRFGDEWGEFFGSGNLKNTSGGGALELDYKAPEKNIKFKTNNFYTYDTFYKDPNPRRFRNRYRLQGEFKGMSDNKKLETFARWDKLSDRFMRQDFPTRLFEISTLERTEAFFKARYEPVFSSIYARPRLNDFRGFKQELPTVTFAVKPYNLGSTNFVFENYFKLGYLEYSYAKQLNDAVPNFSSGRLETEQRLYYPLPIKYIDIIPEVGFTGIYYSDSQKRKDAGQALGSYGVDVHTSFEKSYTKYKHVTTPYANYKGLTKPTSPVGTPYIFSIDDGFNTLNQFKYGLKNDFFLPADYQLLPRFSLDLFGYSFLGASPLNKAVYKAYLDLELNYPRMQFITNVAYNVEENALDHVRFALGWTMNEYFSFYGEFRHRTKYDWRKNNYRNYILDVTRPINDLLATPLSDHRDIFHMRSEVRIAPFWTFQVASHFGKRPFEPFYQQTRFGGTTIISNTWKIGASYIFTSGKDTKFEFTANLI